ncbi:hypothetical protein [Youngiibacter multivorans]|uniref:Alw26I/Eco31I/Esp3I family type II restriction endonuclease n=1 Tax=Youngiibacter multivorans TaxID=937251 RepID=A0ABS4G8P4_9CLOT|nr:hypothetical protein [Youngiibacter multivorans]MBP1920914.1 Alw26I/Eco31I/Esp3I family type II restriction endonuclease [Youngiibacter multivorans]
MAKSNRNWHQNFYEYIDYIVNHDNYSGLPILRSDDGSYRWIAVKQSKIGRQRIAWADKKASEFNIPNVPGVYAEVMRMLHPTKLKVCQICGESLSIYYFYPNSIFLKALKKEFGYDFTSCNHISDIWDILIENEVPELTVRKFFNKKFEFPQEYLILSKKDLIDKCEQSCRLGGKTYLGPGAMSNFPDRYDGFHTYNRCCRALEDKGRSSENLKSYTKDRRAYEYWSDGNIHAANMYMGSDFFSNTTADHIGPISLGFVHDPRYLQPMDFGNNASKRDRLQIDDIEKILEVESRTRIYPMSWYSSTIWEYIKMNYKFQPQYVSTVYRDILKQNMVNFMFILGNIFDKCTSIGEEVLTEILLKPKYDYFASSYGFNNLGDIVTTSKRHYTERNINEMKRFSRIAIDSVKDFNSKENRNIDAFLTQAEMNALDRVCTLISSRAEISLIKLKIESLMQNIQYRLLSTISKRV